MLGVSRHQRIDHGGGLVIQDRFGVLRQRARDGDGALHPGAEFGGKFIGYGVTSSSSASSATRASFCSSVKSVRLSSGNAIFSATVSESNSAPD